MHIISITHCLSFALNIARKREFPICINFMPKNII